MDYFRLRLLNFDSKKIIDIIKPYFKNSYEKLIHATGVEKEKDALDGANRHCTREYG